MKTVNTIKTKEDPEKKGKRQWKKWVQQRCELPSDTWKGNGKWVQEVSIIGIRFWYCLVPTNYFRTVKYNSGLDESVLIFCQIIFVGTNGIMVVIDSYRIE